MCVNRATWPFVRPSYQGSDFHALIHACLFPCIIGKRRAPRADVIHSNTYTFIHTASSSAPLVTVVVGRWCLSVLKQFANGFTLPFTAHLASAHLQWKINMKHAVRNDTCMTTLCTHGPYALKYAHTYTNKHKVTPAR